MKSKFIAAAVLPILALTACGSAQPSVDAGANDSVPAPVVTEAPAETSAVLADAPIETTAETVDVPAENIAFDYVLNGQTIVCGDEAAAVLEQLGAPDTTFEAPSCAFTGVSYFYTYGGVQVVTYPDENDQSLNRFYEVDLLDSSAATVEGIKVGDTYEQMLAAYGKPASETTAYAMYQTDGKAVRFFLEGNTIKEIVYTVVLT